MPGPTRKRGVGEEKPVREMTTAERRPLREAVQRERVLHQLGPDMMPGRRTESMPEADQIPPKPKRVVRATDAAERTGGWPKWPIVLEWALYHDIEAGTVKWAGRWVPEDERRCVARCIGATNPWHGNRCASLRVRGMRVCKTHGGKLPNIIKGARTTLAIASWPAAEQLVHIALRKKGVSDGDRIKAIREILDRSGVESRATVELEVKPWQKVLQNVYRDGLLDSTVDGAEDDEVEGEDYEVDEEPRREDDDDD